MTSSQSDWNVERFGPERPVCRHDFRTLAGERDRYMEALRRIVLVHGDSMGAVPAEALADIAGEALDRG